jgi:hypothetical protein
VVEARAEGDLFEEALHLAWVSGEVGVEELDRHPAPLGVGAL